MGSVRGPRARTVSNRSRWKKETAFEAIQKSKEAGRKHTVKGGVARLSFGPDGPGDDDDTLWVWDEEELLPNGSAMTAARKATFDDRWPYTGRRGWRPTSNKLSEAGFHYTPTDDEEDGCACIYCGVELGGWEKTDDPIHEHQRRRPDCPFFHCIIATALDEDEQSQHEGDTSHKRSASGEVRKGKKGSYKEEDSLDDISMEILPRKKRTTRSVSARGRTVAAAEPVSAEEEVPLEFSLSHMNEDDVVEQTSHEVPQAPSIDKDESQAILTMPSTPPESMPVEEPRHSTPSPKKTDTQDHSMADLEFVHSSALPPPTRSSPTLEAVSTIPAPVQNSTSDTPPSTKSLSQSVAMSTNESDDEAMVENLVTSPLPPTKPALSLPRIEEYLPIPFPHRHSSIDVPPMPDPHQVTVLEWVTQQQTYLLDTMRERIEQRLASMRQKNAEERKKLEKTLRS